MLPDVFLPEREKHADSDIWLKPRRVFLPGGRYLLKAESGRGKSSLCRYIHGNRDDYQGRLEILGKNGRELPPGEWLRMRRNSIAYLPQEIGLFPELTAMENILLKNNLTNHKTPEEIKEMLDSLHMADYASRPAGILSLGQQQRVALVRTLCQPFRILLLDEPVSHLDVSANYAVARLVATESAKNNATVIVTSVGNDLHLDDCEVLHL